ncbi:unnamed protein product [Brassica oleracea]|uniref:(rape) hypothetical protein n=1 Tax=Brassica napus TaxID=3708 RepID=A0A816RQ72_BRANA|nr:unnamed protein product [Brassica napus]
MSLIASDFSYLPDVKVPGKRAPLVSTKVSDIRTFNYTCLGDVWRFMEL